MIMSSDKHSLSRSTDGLVNDEHVGYGRMKILQYLSPILWVIGLSFVINGSKWEVWGAFLLPAIMGTWFFLTDKSTYRRWKHTVNADGIMEDMYGLVQVQIDGYYHRAHIHPLTKRLVVRCDFFEAPIAVRVWKKERNVTTHLFQLVDGQVKIVESELIRMGLEPDYRGDKVRAYLDNTVVFLDKDGESEYSMYALLNEIQDPYIM